MLFSSGAFGGAERRFTNLFLHLHSLSNGKFHFIINHRLKQQLSRAFSDLPEKDIHVIGAVTENATDNDAKAQSGISPEPDEIDKSSSFPRKVYWYFKNKFRQKKLFREIEKIRAENNIEVFIGVFSGILPLVFYLDHTAKRPGIIFSDMDSWFSEVHSDMKKLWYRKYYSFNFAFENADAVDFLSPYIAEGVKERNVRIPAERISIAPCSFADYSKCRVGNKDKFKIAFSSRLEPGKSPMLYLEAAEEVLKTYPDAGFHILGEGTLEGEVESFIDSRGLKEKIKFRFHPNPPEIFSETSVFVSLQTGTNYPSQSILEAMASGNAIIASNKGDTGMFINSSNGVLVELNKDSVVSAMKMLINDREYTKKLGAAAVKTATQNHTLEKMSEYYLRLIQQVNTYRNG